MERQARAAGARFEVRDGWNVAVSYPGESLDAVGVRGCLAHAQVRVARASCPRSSSAARPSTASSTWLPMTTTRALILGGGAPAGAIEVTTGFGALRLAGPLARETFARFTAIDLRPHVTKPGDWRPGSVARTGGGILCEAEDRYLMLFGSALGQYVWTVVADAAGHLGGGPGRRRRARPGGGPCVTSSASAACGGRGRTSRSATTS